MAKIETKLLQTLKERPEDARNLIVRVTGDLERRAATLSGRGITVRRQLGLTNSLAIRCSAEEALKLRRLSWVAEIEADGIMRALRG